MVQILPVKIQLTTYSDLSMIFSNKAAADKYESDYSAYDDNVTKFWSIHEGNLKLWGVPGVTNTTYLEGNVLHHVSIFGKRKYCSNIVLFSSDRYDPCTVIHHVSLRKGTG